MTHEQAERILCCVDLVRKQKGHGWQWRDPDVLIDGTGTALVTVARHVDPRRMVVWFGKATASLHHIEDAGGDWWRVYFTLQEIGENP